MNRIVEFRLGFYPNLKKALIQRLDDERIIGFGDKLAYAKESLLHELARINEELRVEVEDALEAPICRICGLIRPTAAVEDIRERGKLCCISCRTILKHEDYYMLKNAPSIDEKEKMWRSIKTDIVGSRPYIYISHPNSINYKERLYKPMHKSCLGNYFDLILPHEESEDEIKCLRQLLHDGCACLIADLSQPSTGSGIEQGYAYERGVPVVAIYKKGSNPSRSARKMASNVLEYQESVEELLPQLHKLAIEFLG